MASPDVVRLESLGEDQLKAYRDDGYVVIPGFINVALIDDLRREIFEVLNIYEDVSKESLEQASTAADKLRQSEFYQSGSALDSLINSENTLSVAGALIGGKAIRYLPFTAVKAAGGGGSFDFHQDNNYTEHRPALGSVNIWVALTRMTEDNGCLRIVPGSHLAGTLESVDVGDGSHLKLAESPSFYRSITVNAGDAIAFSRLTVHGSGPNTTNEPRVAYALQYHREDVEYRDDTDGSWKLLARDPKFQTPPVARLARRAS